MENLYSWILCLIGMTLVFAGMLLVAELLCLRHGMVKSLKMWGAPLWGVLFIASDLMQLFGIFMAIIGVLLMNDLSRTWGYLFCGVIFAGTSTFVLTRDWEDCL